MNTKRIASLTFIAVALVGAFWFHSQGSIEIDPRVWRDRIGTLGWLAPVGFIAAATLRPLLLLPSWVIMSTGGLLFGVAGGIVWGSVGFSLGALLMFALARSLGRAAVARLVTARIDGYVSQRGPLWIAVYTALPVTPLTPVHSAAGLSGMSVAGFGLAVFAGFVPRTAVYSFFGDSVAQGDGSRIAAALSAIVLAAIVGTIWVRRIPAIAPHSQGSSTDRQVSANPSSKT